MSDVRHIWSWVREFNPKKTKPCSGTHTSTQQAEGSPQAGGHLIPGEHPGNVEMVEASLGKVPTTISPIAATPRSRSITPPAHVCQLWEKANKALEELLATKSSIDAHRWKVVLEQGMELHQNDSETVESIKEARAICTHVGMDAEALCSSTVKEAKATYAHPIQEAKTACSMAIRDAETWGASQAESLHR